MMVEGKTPNATLARLYELTGWVRITSNNNQSTAYVLRQRVIWGQAETTTTGVHRRQLWSMERKIRRASQLSGDIMTQTIDEYRCGLRLDSSVWFRVTKTFNHVAFGVAAEIAVALFGCAGRRHALCDPGLGGRQRRQL